MNSLTAKAYFSGFELAHDTYNAITAASNGKIYYVLCSESYEIGGQMYAYDPTTDQTEWIADLTEICGEKDANAIPQGKSHVRFYENNGKLYFATHIGVYEMIDGMERLPQNAPNGKNLYPGGHFLSYDLATGAFEDLAVAPEGEGILTMTIDRERGHLYGITWPLGYFIHYDISAKTLKKVGLVSAKGEAGIPGDDYRVLCRSMVVDPRDGAVYFSTSEGDIFTYHPDKEGLHQVEGIDLRIRLFWKIRPQTSGKYGLQLA